MRAVLFDDEQETMAPLAWGLTALGFDVVRAKGTVVAAARDALDVVVCAADAVPRARAWVGERAAIVALVAAGDAERGARAIESGADDWVDAAAARVVAHRARACVETRALRARVAEIGRERRAIVGLVAYDLNSPLTVVSANIEWIRDNVGVSDPEAVDAILETIEATRRMHAVLDDVQTLGRIEDRKLALARESLDARAIARDALQACVRLADERRVLLAALDDGDVRADADPALLRRVVEHVVEHVVRHTPAGGRVIVETRASDRAEIGVFGGGPGAPEGFHRARREIPSRGAWQAPSLALHLAARALDAMGGALDALDPAARPPAFLVRAPRG